MIATLTPVKGSLRDRSPGVWPVRVSPGRNPGDAPLPVCIHCGARDGAKAQRSVARPLNQVSNTASQRQVPLAKQIFGALLARWLDYMKTRRR
jgi:hypothetical protein